MDPSHPLYNRLGKSVHEVGPEALESFFDGPRNGRFRLEATTHHVFQETAQHFVRSLVPSPHIVLMLREPARRILSSFQFTRDNLSAISPGYSFDEYVEHLLSENYEAMAQHFYSDSSLWIAQRELTWSRYDYWLTKWANIVPESNIHVILFEELRDSPDNILADLLRKLNITTCGEISTPAPRKNETFKIGYRSLHRFVMKINPVIPQSKLKGLLKQFYLSIQSGAAHREINYEQGLQQLRTHFLPELETLSQHWNINVER